MSAWNRHRHTGPEPGMIVWDAIAYTSRSPHVRIDGTLKSARYISGVLRPVALPLFERALCNLTLKPVNARPHVAGSIRTFLDTENFQLLSWPARSPDLSPIENVWSLVVERLACHHTPVITVDELRYRVEAAWSSLSVHAIQCLFDSMPSCYNLKKRPPPQPRSEITTVGDLYAYLEVEKMRYELWFQQDGATCHTARATIDLLKDTFGDRLNSRFGPVNWPRSCDLTTLDYFLWGYVKSLVYADKPQTLDHLEDNIRRVIADIRPQMLEKVIENWTSRLDYIRASCGSYMPEIIFKM
ncbi:transposable element Tcb1 transposase [Trichonephila clavipes]|nr:transposable element Tcb1 transposase [Trichonephila clavipes]